MEWLFLLSLFFVKTKHFCGFSHWKQKGWNSLYVISDHEDLELYIDGYPTGLQAPCRIYLEPGKIVTRVELKRLGRTVFQKNVEVYERKTFVMGHVPRDIHLLA